MRYMETNCNAERFKPLEKIGWTSPHKSFCRFRI